MCRSGRVKGDVTQVQKSSAGTAPRFSRFVVAGVWNTIFGYGVFALLVAGFSDHVHYLFIAGLSNALAISNAYLVHKIMVFRTRGNYLKEYARYWVVYGASGVLGLGLLALFVSGLGINIFLSQAGVLAIQVAVTFTGHRSYSFGSPNGS